MAQSKYFPDLQDKTDTASVEPIKKGFSAVEADVTDLSNKITDVRDEVMDATAKNQVQDSQISKLTTDLSKTTKALDAKENVSNKATETDPDLLSADKWTADKYPNMALTKELYDRNNAFIVMIQGQCNTLETVDTYTRQYIIGELSDLKTYDKTCIVNAINEVAQPPVVWWSDLGSSSPFVLPTNKIITFSDYGYGETYLGIKLPGGDYGSWIQVDFDCLDTPLTLEILSNCLSEIDLIPEANTTYSLFFDYGMLHRDGRQGWRMTYTAYPHVEV